MADTADINEQLAATEQRLNRERKAWEKRVPEVERERIAAVPAELKKLLADLCACGLTVGTSNRLVETIGAGYPVEATMLVLCRVVMEGAEPPTKSLHWPFADQRRLPELLNADARFWLARLLTQLDGGPNA